MTNQTFNITKVPYKGYSIEMNNPTDGSKSNSALIYKDGNLFKCIAGDIFKDGSNNREDKAKKFIDSL